MTSTAGALQGKQRACRDFNSLPWNSTKDSKGRVRLLSCWAIPSIEEDLDQDHKMENRASEAPTIASFQEYPTSPIEPMDTSYLWHGDESNSVASRVRKRRAASRMCTISNRTDLCSQGTLFRFESDDKTPGRRPSSEAWKLGTSATEFSGPLDEMVLESNLPIAFDKLGSSESRPIKIEDHSDSNIDLPNLTRQELFSVLLYGKKGAQENSSSGSKPIKSVKTNDRRRFTYRRFFHEAEKAESSNLQPRGYASVPSKNMSLVNKLRKAAAERDEEVSMAELPVSRKETCTSASVSSTSKSGSEYSDPPARPSTESPDDASYAKPPMLTIQKQNARVQQLTSRKHTFVYSPIPDLVSSMIDYVEYIYKLFDEDLTENDCWLHPSPPSPQFGRNKRAISHRFMWVDGNEKQRLTVNFAIVVLLVQNRLTEVQKRGYVTHNWQVSKICGNWTCCNWHHFALEPREVSNTRSFCWRYKHHKSCRHDPPCLIDKKCYPPPSEATTGEGVVTDKRVITARRTGLGHPSRPSVSTSLSTAKDKFRIQKPSVSRIALRREANKPPYPSPSTLLRSANLDCIPHTTNPPAPRTQSGSPESISYVKNPAPLPSRSVSPESIYYTPNPSSFPTPTRSASPESPRVPETPPPPQTTTTAKPTFSSQDDSSPHNPGPSSTESSILGKTLELFHPAARNLKSAFRAVALLVTYESDLQE